MNRTIRKATAQDMEAIMAVFDAARKIMADSGNTNQWKNGYPSEEIVLSDMEKDGGFVIEDGGQIVGYFAYLPSPEPTYSKIYDGEWVYQTLPYHVIQRIASFPDAHGIFKSIMEFSFAHESNIRIDTHKDNHIMQHNILKQRFNLLRHHSFSFW